ncbi:diaminopimelate epimerase [Streptomyces subrutilus]|uniref:diaminopimelate epimerase n=1 Tax=Streptomyces subrutilus TaxID=36818 RepID=UPI0033DF77E6
MRSAPAGPPVTLPFTKMHGAGNDFVVLDLRQAPDPTPELCRVLADRHMGIGCDLILGIKEPRSPRAVVSFDIWTADGSPSRQCGNGARCVAAWAVRAGLTPGRRFDLDSPSGPLPVEVLDLWSFSIALAVPDFAPSSLPLTGYAHESELYEAEVEGEGQVRFAAVSMGNPHAVIEVDDVSTAPVGRLGRAVQDSPFLPSTVNVGFAEVVSRERVRLRVHEFGAGETLACGSGACAAAAVLMRRGRVDRSVRVELPGGEIRIDWPDPEARILMTGPAAFVFEGEFSHAPVRQHS